MSEITWNVTATDPPPEGQYVLVRNLIGTVWIARLTLGGWWYSKDFHESHPLAQYPHWMPFSRLPAPPEVPRE